MDHADDQHGLSLVELSYSLDTGEQRLIGDHL